MYSVRLGFTVQLLGDPGTPHRDPPGGSCTSFPTAPEFRKDLDLSLVFCSTLPFLFDLSLSFSPLFPKQSVRRGTAQIV